jgi:histidine ammonia-lyase
MSDHQIHSISSELLTIQRVGEILEQRMSLTLSQDAIRRITSCREYLDRKIQTTTDPIYGITTGFGSLCNISIDNNQLSQLQKNLVMSHACGTGDEVAPEIVKLMLLLKIQSLSYGNSGVQLATVQRLIDFFNNDILPVVYSQGSLGASGDLAPLAHLSLPLLGLGEVRYNGQRLATDKVLKEKGWEPLTLMSKEGLALLNGTQFMSAHGVYALLKANRLLKQADKIAAMSLEAFDGRIEPFGKEVNEVRNHPGQIETAAAFRELLADSQLICRKKAHVQDPYSFRCIPQVHGAAKDTFHFVYEKLEEEINAPTDNPTIFPEEDLIVSAGNFHGEPIAMPMDFLAVAMAELGNIAERRIYRLISGVRNLPSFLVANPGLNSGFMIPQYAAASIVSQSKGLCWPNSVDSIPSSQGQEDHVSMGSNAATKLIRVVDNTERVLAIELFNAAQALEFRGVDQTSSCLKSWHHAYRKVVPFISDDCVMHPWIEASVQFLQNDK